MIPTHSQTYAADEYVIMSACTPTSESHCDGPERRERSTRPTRTDSPSAFHPVHGVGMLQRAWRGQACAGATALVRRRPRRSGHTAASKRCADEVVVVSGLPRGNPPSSLAFKLKELFGLRATPTLLQRPATSEALLLTHTDADAQTVRNVCAPAAGHIAEPADVGLGPRLQFSLRSIPATADLLSDTVDGRPWGAHVLCPSADSNLAAGPDANASQKVAQVEMSATAERVLRRGGTDPKGLTVLLGGFDDHFEEGVYLCAGCHNPLYSSEMKFSCGCGWPVSILPAAVLPIQQSTHLPFLSFDFLLLAYPPTRRTRLLAAVLHTSIPTWFCWTSARPDRLSGIAWKVQCTSGGTELAVSLSAQVATGTLATFTATKASTTHHRTNVTVSTPPHWSSNQGQGRMVRVRGSSHNHYCISCFDTLLQRHASIIDLEDS